MNLPNYPLLEFSDNFRLGTKLSQNNHWPRWDKTKITGTYSKSIYHLCIHHSRIFITVLLVPFQFFITDLTLKIKKFLHESYYCQYLRTMVLTRLCFDRSGFFWGHGKHYSIYSLSLASHISTEFEFLKNLIM